MKPGERAPIADTRSARSGEGEAVAPGADPDQIRLDIGGSAPVRKDGEDLAGAGVHHQAGRPGFGQGAGQRSGDEVVVAGGQEGGAEASAVAYERFALPASSALIAPNVVTGTRVMAFIDAVLASGQQSTWKKI